MRSRPFPNSGIPELPALLTIKGAIMTIDAMGCRRGICRRIIDREADYVIGLKGNQGCLRGDVKLFLDGHLERGTGGDCIRQGGTIAGDHGRIETRRSTVCPDAEWIRDRHHWPGLKSVMKPERSGRPFYIASLDDSPENISKCIRDHYTFEITGAITGKSKTACTGFWT